MTTHRIDRIIRRDAYEVAEPFCARPASWLGAFLLLAIRQGSVKPGSPRQQWFRLKSAPIGPRTTQSDGPVAVRFIWWPHRSSGIFEQFHGEFRVEPQPTGCKLELCGDTSGGSDAENQFVLNEVVRLIGDAMSAERDAA